LGDVISKSPALHGMVIVRISATDLRQSWFLARFGQVINNQCRLLSNSARLLSNKKHQLCTLKALLKLFSV